MAEKNTWSHFTEDEKRFLNKLGSFSTHVESTRLELLELYKKSIPSRLNWGNISKAKIIKHVDKLISQTAGL